MLPPPLDIIGGPPDAGTPYGPGEGKPGVEGGGGGGAELGGGAGAPEKPLSKALGAPMLPGALVVEPKAAAIESSVGAGAAFMFIMLNVDGVALVAD